MNANIIFAMKDKIDRYTEIIVDVKFYKYDQVIARLKLKHDCK